MAGGTSLADGIFLERPAGAFAVLGFSFFGGAIGSFADLAAFCWAFFLAGASFAIGGSSGVWIFGAEGFAFGLVFLGFKSKRALSNSGTGAGSSSRLAN